MPRQPVDEYPGVVHGDAIYALDDFKRRMRMQNKALRSARDRGLRIIPCGTRRYIYGRDFIEFMSGQSAGSTSKE